MTDYRRVFLPGGCYFFTVVTQDRRPLFGEADNVERLRDGFRRVMAAHPFAIDAVVIMPDHVHTVWRLPDGDADYPLRWRKIKHFVSIGIETAGAARASLSRRREKGIWQRRYWEHAICDEADWQRHVDYVHFNPVKHGLCHPPGGMAVQLISSCVGGRLVCLGVGGTIAAVIGGAGYKVGRGRVMVDGHAALCPSYLAITLLGLLTSSTSPR